MKLLMILAKKGFRDEEFNIPFEYFKQKKITIDIASTKKGDCIGKFGTQVVATYFFV